MRRTQEIPFARLLRNESQIDRAKSVLIEWVAADRYQLNLRGRVERVGPCPVCGGVDRFAINIKKQVWNCRVCRKGGDVIALVQHLDSVDFSTAVQILIEHAPTDIADRFRRVPYPVRADVTAYEQRQHEKARRLWQNRKSITGSPAEIYLREARACTGPIPPTLAYLPPSRLGHHPALIAAFALAEEIEPGVLIAPRDVAAVHLTLLRPDGSGKAEVEDKKLAVGRPLGRPIVLAPMNDLLGLAIVEGIENGLSLQVATGLGMWCAGSATMMPKLAEAVPDFVDCVRICADNDEAGQRNATALYQRLAARGIYAEVRPLARAAQ